MLNKTIVPWFAGSLMLVLLGLMSFTNQGFAQDNATASSDAPEAAVDAAAPADAPAEVATIDSGDTAWMIVATLLVLFMTIPGLSLFYGGLVRSKNILSVLVQCFAITSIITILWVLYGYSLAFNTDGMEAGVTNYNSFVGGLGTALLANIGSDTVSGTIPEVVFITFQMTFAIITPALIVGAFAERMKFSAVLIFTLLWFTFSYAPICHMAWSGDGALFNTWGVIDFAGGTVVHINAGIAGLIACIMVGKRKGFGSAKLTPHSVPLTVIGASMLWVGWFGFNAGSELAADGVAGMAMLVTQVASATAAASWMFVEWFTKGKPTAVGLATGAVAGLVAITPASGSVGPMGAILIGAASAVICYWAATSIKAKFGYDDSLDVFGVHGVGGIVGALLTGCLVVDATHGGESFVIGDQLWIQAKSVLFTIAWSGVVSFIALKIAGAVVGGIRSDEDSEETGLDLTDHGETGYSS
ncbi:ammonium transporter [Opitutales bacterium]|jgi:ammonium transporter, Amt family|nr:ammonium transporter [Opitutales bacterium]